MNTSLQYRLMPRRELEDDRARMAVFGRVANSDASVPSSGAQASPAALLAARRAEKAALGEYFGVPATRVYFVKQVHGTLALRLSAPQDDLNDDLMDDSIYLGEADALWTDEPELVLCVRTADCLPVFFTAGEDRGPRAAGVIHAGWRGLAAGIVPDTLELVQKITGAAPRVYPGPAISCEVYETGADVAERFSIVERREDRFYVDLPANARKQTLERLPNAIWDESLSECVYLGHDRYYSHRRGDLGRNLNAIMLKQR